MARTVFRAPVPPKDGQDISWHASAACLTADPELFFPVSLTGPAATAQIHAAKSWCGRCPVRDRCLAYAVDTGQTAGIWGGHDVNERRLIRQRQRAEAGHPGAPAGPRS